MIKIILTCLILCAQQHVYSSDKINTDQPEKIKAFNCITGFLQWYKTNLQKAHDFPVLGKDKEGYYSVDKTACSNYLQFLLGSNFISANYIGYWQRFFDDKAEMLLREKTKGSLPEDFDMDFVLVTQKPKIVLNNIGQLKFKVMSMNNKTAVIGVTLPTDKSVKYKFEMIKAKTGWQIDYISTANFD